MSGDKRSKGSNVQIARGNLNAAVWNKRSREKAGQNGLCIYRRCMEANGSRRNHEKRKEAAHRGKRRGGGGRKWRVEVDGTKWNRGREWSTAKRQKRRLDYTSPAARSLFGRNRFFITKSLTGFIPNCTFGDPRKTHRPRLRTYMYNTSTRVAMEGRFWEGRENAEKEEWRIIDHLYVCTYIPRARVLSITCGRGNKRTQSSLSLSLQVPFTSSLQFAKMDHVSKLMRGKSTYRLLSWDLCIFRAASFPVLPDSFARRF